MSRQARPGLCQLTADSASQLPSRKCKERASALGRPTTFYGSSVGLCLEHRYYSRCVNTCQHF